ncbi:uncharacterized protein TNCV_3839251 [Trichonephila clavipes]|nr:uncharacterized protein TNCV_3839251 [Trichonephila clavipes]
MPGKRTRRHFSQLSEFERGLIIGMKIAGWSTRCIAGQVDRSEWAVRNCWEQWTREGTHARKPGLERPGRPRGQRIEGSHLAEVNLKSKRPFRALPLTPEHRQLRLQWCQARSMWNVTDWQKVVFSDESRFVWGQMITVYGCEGTLTLPWPAHSSDWSHVEHVWDQLKRQMSSCHSVHDLELAVQDLWAHLPQDNIRCLINSMPDRLAACIAAGGGSTRY